MAMKVRANLRSRLLVPAVAALVASISYPAFAGDPVKTRTDYDRPGRQIDDGAPAKTSAATKSFWRGLDDEGTPVKTGDGAKKFGRAAQEDGTPVKTRGATNVPGRAPNRDHASNTRYKPIDE
jgi:hypothetical protein